MLSHVASILTKTGWFMKLNVIKSITYKQKTSYNVYYRAFINQNQCLTANHVLSHAAQAVIGARSFQQRPKAVLMRFLRPCFLHLPQFLQVTKKQNPSPANQKIFSPLSHRIHTTHGGAWIQRNGLFQGISIVRSHSVNCVSTLLNPIIEQLNTWPASLSKNTFGVVKRLLSNSSLHDYFFTLNINSHSFNEWLSQYTRPLALKKASQPSKRFAFLFLAAGYGVGKHE